MTGVETGPLPWGFKPLEPFVERWAVAPAAKRADARRISTAAQRQTFYDAMIPLAPLALEYLDARPIADFDARKTRLMNLLLSFAHVSLAIEVQGDQEDGHGAMRQYLHITRASADA